MKSKMCFFLLLLSVSFACTKTQSAVSRTEIPPTVSAQTNEPDVSAANGVKSFAPAKDLKSLREWIGKHPINADDTKHRNFFETPEVKQILVGILQENGFQKLLKHFSQTDVIKEKDGFLVMLGTTAKNVAKDIDYALVAINPDTGETHILFSDDRRLSSFDNAKGAGTLTAAVKQQILVHTEAAQNEVIGTLEQRPAEGFPCYAVLPKDWGGTAAKRPLVFAATDNGGIFNVEGRDIEIKMSDSQETKGENGRIYAEWIFDDKRIKAKFDLAVEKTLNDGADIQYEGTLTITTAAKTQTVQIRAFCGG